MLTFKQRLERLVARHGSIAEVARRLRRSEKAVRSWLLDEAQPTLASEIVVAQALDATPKYVCIPNFGSPLSLTVPGSDDELQPFVDDWVVFLKDGVRIFRLTPTGSLVAATAAQKAYLHCHDTEYFEVPVTHDFASLADSLRRIGGSHGHAE